MRQHTLTPTIDFEVCSKRLLEWMVKEIRREYREFEASGKSMQEFFTEAEAKEAGATDV